MPELTSPAFTPGFEGPVNKTPSAQGSLTVPQVVHEPDIYDGRLPERLPTPDWLRKVRVMRKDATISMVRGLSITPALLGPWTFESRTDAPEGAKEFLQVSLQGQRNLLIRNALLGCVDYGWQGFEQVYGLDKDGRTVVKWFKPLLQDFTWIIVDPQDGSFMGFKQERNNFVSQVYVVYVPKDISLLHSFDPPGTYWYGHGYMENAEDVYDWWNKANDAAIRYDEKLAGAHWVVQFPDGVSEWNGVETPNYQIAQEILQKLKSSGGIAVPRRVAAFIEDLNMPKAENQWEIKLVTAQTNASAGFEGRLRYLDNLKVRALGFPERSILEGQFGTKAEAGVHADFAIAQMELRHDDLITNLNQQVIDKLLRMNFGEEAEGSVYIVRGPIADASRKYLQDIYMKILSNPQGWMQEFGNIDREVLKQLTQVPIDEEYEEPDFEEMQNMAIEARKQGLENGIQQQDGRGASVRKGEHPSVGRHQQSGGPTRGSSQDKLGDITR